MEDDKIIDSAFIQKYISRAFQEKIREKWLSVSEVAKRMWVSQPYISRILSWKDISLKTWKLEQISVAVWFSKSEFKDMIKNSKREEFKNLYGESIENNDDKLNLKVALKRDYGIKDEQALEDIKNFLEFIKVKYSDESE